MGDPRLSLGSWLNARHLVGVAAFCLIAASCGTAQGGGGVIIEEAGQANIEPFDPNNVSDTVPVAAEE